MFLVCPSQGRGWRGVRGTEIRSPASSPGSATGRQGGRSSSTWRVRANGKNWRTGKGGKEGQRLVPAHIPSGQG